VGGGYVAPTGKPTAPVTSPVPGQKASSPKPAKAPKPNANKGKGKGGNLSSNVNDKSYAWNNPNNPLADPTSTLSGKTLIQAAVALANAQTNPAIQGLQDQINFQNKFATGQQKTDMAYFNALGKFGQQGAQNINSTNAFLSGALDKVGHDTQDQLGQIGENAQNSLTQYTPGDPSLRTAGMQGLTQELARQKGLAAQDAGVFRSGGLLQGANYSNLANANQGAYASAGREDISRIAQANLTRQEPLTSKIAQLRANRGNLIATDLGRLRQQEISNRFTSKGLDIKDMANKITAANDKAKNALTARGQDITLRGQDLRVQNDQATTALGWARLGEKKQNDLANQAIREANAAGKSGGKTRLSQTGNNTMLALLDTAVAAVHGAGGANKQQVIDSLSSGGAREQVGTRPGKDANGNPIQIPVYKSLPRVPTVLAEAAYELLGWGYITHQTAAAMHNMGIYGGTFRGSPIRVQNAPVSSGPVDALGQGAALGAIPGL
jgi:hypothetical protein